SSADCTIITSESNFRQAQRRILSHDLQSTAQRSCAQLIARETNQPCRRTARARCCRNQTLYIPAARAKFAYSVRRGPLVFRSKGKAKSSGFLRNGPVFRKQGSNACSEAFSP